MQTDSNHETAELDMEAGSYSGFSADEPSSCSEKPARREDLSAPKRPGDFPPLKSCVDQVVEFPDVLGTAPDDFQLFDCTGAGGPLRVLLNPTDDWVYPVMSTSYHAHLPRAMAEFEHEVGNFRNALNISVAFSSYPFHSIRHEQECKL